MCRKRRGKERRKKSDRSPDNNSKVTATPDRLFVRLGIYLPEKKKKKNSYMRGGENFYMCSAMVDIMDTLKGIVFWGGEGQLFLARFL